MDDRDLEELTEKLKKEGDISLKEADRVFSLFSRKNLNTKLTPKSRDFDPLLGAVVNGWFEAVYALLGSDKRGNFVTTIPLEKLDLENLLIEANFIDKCRKSLSDEDCFTLLMVGEKTFKSLPERTKKLFREETYGYEKYYCFYNYRAGIYSRLNEVTKDLEPVLTSRWPDLCGIGFKLAVGALGPDSSEWLACSEEAYFIAVASFMKVYGISPVCVKFSDRKTFLAADRKDLPVMEEVLEFPFEALVQNAVDEGIISQKMARALKNNNPIRSFPVADFADMCARVLKFTVDANAEFIKMRREIEEGKWLDVIK